MTNTAGGGNPEQSGCKAEGAVGAANEGTENLGVRSIQVRPLPAASADDVPAKPMTRDLLDGQIATDLAECSEGLDQNIQLELGRQLKAMFDEVATAPIPENLLELLAALEQEEQRR